jgi:acetyl esterase/lipase
MPPEHPFPAAVDDGVAVYRELLESYGAEDIAIFGTSAGGGLAAAVTLAARDAGLPLPAAVIMHTPWTDLSKTGDSYFTNDRVDPIIPTYDGQLAAAAKLYAGDAGLKHPLVSPVYADYGPGFPPALLSTGTRDLLLSATVRLHRELRRAGVPAELHVFDAMWHGLSNMPEGQELQTEVLAFLAEHLGD